MIDAMKERELNLKDIPGLKHIDGEIYSFNGIKIDMQGCGSQHMQMYRHIAVKLADQITKERNRLSEIFNSGDGIYRP